MPDDSKPKLPAIPATLVLKPRRGEVDHHVAHPRKWERGDGAVRILVPSC
jgi:hypothetical protein